MKKFDGITPLRLVLADDGKKGPFGPAPSSNIEVGTTAGFWMRYDARRTAPWRLTYTIDPTIATSVTTTATRMIVAAGRARSPSGPAAVSRAACRPKGRTSRPSSTGRTPSTDAAMWV